MMINKAAIWGTSLSVALLSTSAFAVAPIGNTTQKGSLLIFPRIDVSYDKDTIIRITNDYSKPVQLKCYFMDIDKNKVDFEFKLTMNQPFWFSAKYGNGTLPVQPFPTFGDHDTGELKCWAVSSNGANQISWNHLVGSATIYDYSGQAAEYNAWGFQALAPEGSIVGHPGRLDLDGVSYDKCPRTLIGQFTPTAYDNAIQYGDWIRGSTVQLSVASCTQDLRQDYEYITTKLQFDVWNEEEVKFTGAHECSDSWHEVYLNEEDIMTAGKNFTAETLKTDSAYYRVKGMKSKVCDDKVFFKYDKWGNKIPIIVPTRDVGLTGVQVSEVDGSYVSATTLHGRGKFAGSILWDTAPAGEDDKR
jgi:hypothetical protein